MEKTVIYWLWFKCLFPIGTDKARKIIDAFDRDPYRLYLGTESTYRAAGIDDEDIKKLLYKNLDEAKKLYRVCRQNNAYPIWFTHPLFPKTLSEREDMPLVIFAKGNLGILNHICACIVGAREASAHGVSCAMKLSRQLAEAGFTILSGSAVGIDQSALSGAVGIRRAVISVPASGLDVNYPSGVDRIMQKVLDAGGVIFTEHMFGERPLPQNFPVRNRILSAMASAVFVVEAGRKSGALLTAGHAMRHGRDLYVFPGYVDDKNYVGCNQLIYDGAVPVVSIEETVKDCFMRYKDLLRTQKHYNPEAIRKRYEQILEYTPEQQAANATPQNPSAAPSSSAQAAPKKDGLPTLKTVPNAPEPKTEAQTHIEQVYHALHHKKMGIEELVLETGLAANVIAAILVTGELTGRIVQDPNGIYSLK